MKAARFHFSQVYRRDPQLEELLAHYESIYQTDSAHTARIRRAEYALRRSTFDITAATEGGYETQRERLMRAVADHAQDRTTGYRKEITTEDLTVYLYAVTRASFAVADDPRQQWTFPYPAAAGMFAKLRSTTGRGGSNRNKLKACRDILERAGLIECLDRGYVVGREGQRWTIARNHPRFAEFVRFAEGIDRAPLKSKACDESRKSGSDLCGTPSSLAELIWHVD